MDALMSVACSVMKASLMMGMQGLGSIPRDGTCSDLIKPTSTGDRLWFLVLRQSDVCGVEWKRIACLLLVWRKLFKIRVCVLLFLVLIQTARIFSVWLLENLNLQPFLGMVCWHDNCDAVVMTWSVEHLSVKLITGFLRLVFRNCSQITPSRCPCISNCTGHEWPWSGQCGLNWTRMAMCGSMWPETSGKNHKLHEKRGKK